MNRHYKLLQNFIKCSKRRRRISLKINFGKLLSKHRNVFRGMKNKMDIFSLRYGMYTNSKNRKTMQTTALDSCKRLTVLPTIIYTTVCGCQTILSRKVQFGILYSNNYKYICVIGGLECCDYAQVLSSNIHYEYVCIMTHT